MAVPVHVSALPDEMLDHIFRQLDVADQGRAAQVCRSWNNLMYSSTMCGNGVIKLNTQDEEQMALLPLMGRRGVRYLVLDHSTPQINSYPNQLWNNLQHFPDLRGIKLLEFCMQKDYHLLSVASLLGNLASLDLGKSQITDEAFSCIARGIVRLKDLTLSSCSSISDTSMASIAAHLHMLRRLTLPDKITDAGILYLTGSDTAGAPIPLPDMEYLDIKICTELTDRSLQLIMAGFPRLSELIVPESEHITPAGYAHLAVRSSLRKLDLSSTFYLEDDCMYELAGADATFTSLDIRSYDAGLTEAGVQHLVERMGQLLHLNLGYNPEMGDGVVTALCTIRSNISTLSFHNSHALTDDGLRRLANLTSLRVLCLDRCLSLTDDGLAYLVTGRCGIENLTLSDFNTKYISDKGLRHLSGGSNLSTLNLIWCPYITGTGFHYLATGAARITTLSFERMSSVQDVHLRHLARMAHLRHLTLNSCNEITEKGLGYLADGNSLITCLEVTMCARVMQRGLTVVAGGKHRPQQPQGLHQLRRLCMDQWSTDAEGMELASRYLRQLKSFNLSGTSVIPQLMSIRSRLFSN